MADEGWFKWAWDRREEIVKFLDRLKKWFRGEEEPKPSRDILILGAGGVGKTTLARFLSEPLQFPVGGLGRYDDSLDVEHYPVPSSPGVELVVPPGQTFRRPSDWDALLNDLKEEQFRGVILVGAYGLHHFYVRDYQNHDLFRDTKKQFLVSLGEHHRREEVEVLRQLTEALRGVRRKTWVLSVVAKADLWWNVKSEAEQFYRSGEYGSVWTSLSSELASGKLRHEIEFVSLLICNFRTSSGQLLFPNVEGFDQPLQVELLRRLCEKFDALRAWEQNG